MSSKVAPALEFKDALETLYKLCQTSLIAAIALETKHNIGLSNKTSGTRRLFCIRLIYSDPVGFYLKRLRSAREKDC
jgi:hypothetical protein